MKSRPWLDTTIVVLGILSFLSLVGYFLALHDIWHDYASPEVWARAGQSLPSWYSPYNRTPGEWAMCQVGFVLILAFHLLLFARFVLRTGLAPK
jgi:hypothetical protein